MAQTIHLANITAIDIETGLIQVDRDLSVATRKHLFMQASVTYLPFTNIWTTGTGSTIQLSPPFAKMFHVNQGVYVISEPEKAAGCGCG